jgi:hypothetical protein
VHHCCGEWVGAANTKPRLKRSDKPPKIGVQSPRRQGRMRLGTTACVSIAGLRPRTLLVSVVLSTILIATNFPPQFPVRGPKQGTVSATSHPDQRPRFEDNGSQWSAPAETFLPAPQATKSGDLEVNSCRFSTLYDKGFHHNRPPPLA